MSGLSFPHTSFPFNVTPVSPAFKLSPISSNISQGWVPSCSTPECVPTASWSTGTVGATLSFQFWGWDAAFYGNVKGNMSVEVFRDGAPETWNPSANVLFSSVGQPADYTYPHNITLKVLDASLGAELTVNQASVNGSAFSGVGVDSVRWVLPSSDPSMKYKGFVPQTSAVQAGSQTTYVSSKAGDTALTHINGSAILIYGPCGPTSGLMKVKLNNIVSVNTSSPIASDDCLLFQSYAIYPMLQHQLLIQNVDGSSLSINRIEFFRVILERGGLKDSTRSGAQNAGIAVGVILGALLIQTVIVIIRRRRSQKVDQMI